MPSPYLEVTFRHGKPFAAYLYLPRPAGSKSHRVERLAAGMLLDLDPEARPLGIEITAPSLVSLAELNRVLARLGLEPLTSVDFAPLLAA